MKELDIFFNAIDDTLSYTWDLNYGKAKLSFWGRIHKKQCQCAIDFQKQVLKTTVKYRLLEKDKNANIQEIRDCENKEMEQLGESISIKVRVIMGLSLQKRWLTTFICNEALYENKFISPINDSIIDEGIEAVRERLLSLDETSRKLYLNNICLELDLNLLSAYYGIETLEKSGWEKFYIVGNICNYLSLLFELFALFDIDLFPIIKEKSNNEKEFSSYFNTYEYYRAEQFKGEKSPLPKDTSSTSSNNVEETLLDYLNVTDKDEWITTANSKVNYQQLADFLGAEVAEGNLNLPPSKKGGGLFNLSCLMFPTVLDPNNKTQKNAVNNAVRKYEGYKEVKERKPKNI